MPFRVTDSSTNSQLSSRIGTQQAQLSVLRERVASGKRINRASDDPVGAETVLRLRTSQSEVEAFKRSTDAANQKLASADSALQSYEPLLDRMRSVVSQGFTDTTSQEGRNALATELDSLRQRALNTANTQSDGEYLFGGTRQSVAPFDPITGAPAAATTGAQYLQLEPGTNAVAIGATADKIFSDATSNIFTDLAAASAALRGTGNAAADKTTLQTTIDRLGIYNNLTNAAHAQIGVNMKTVESSQERLNNDSISLKERTSAVEDADLAATALDLTETDRALQATLQVAAKGRRSLLDYLS